jgi:hypothetical protein
MRLLYRQDARIAAFTCAVGRRVLVMRLTRYPSGVGLQQTDIVKAITIWNAVPS